MKSDGKGLPFLNVLKYLQLGKSELKVYAALAKGPMSIKELKKTTNLSERMLRASISNLLRKDFVNRSAVGGDRLKYVYQANQPVNVADFLRNKMAKIEENRLRSKEEIIKGIKYYNPKRK